MGDDLIERCFYHVFGGEKNSDYLEGKRIEGNCRFCDGTPNNNCEKYTKVEILPLKKYNFH